MDRVWIRSAAISWAFACGTMIAGPGVLGIAQSHAILGIGPDILDLFGDDDDKSDLHHPRPGSEESSSGQAARTVGVTTADAGPPVSTFGSVPETAARVEGESAVPQSAGRGGGGGAVPRMTPAGRSSNLPSVPSAPITRNIVIRGAPSTARPAGSPAPAFVPPALRRDRVSSRWRRRRPANRYRKVVRLRPRHRHPHLHPARKTHWRPLIRALVGSRTRSASGMRSI